MNNSLAIILGTFELLFKKSTSAEETDLAAKELAVIFNRINEYTLNIDNLSDFDDFVPYK